MAEAGEVFVEDLQSSCGTLVNGLKVIRLGLHQRDEIHVGSSVFTFEPGSA